MNLKNKRVLLIGIGFYDYDEIITAQINSLGGEVTYFCQEHSSDFLRKLSKFPLLSGIEKSFSKNYLIENIKNFKDFDEVLVIKGDKIFIEDMECLRANNPNATFRMYQWDSVRRFDGDQRIFKYFDYIFSFDRLDCNEYGFIFLPLFYRDTKARKNDYQYDVSFVGWLHFNRLDLISKLSASLSNMGNTVKFHLYSSSKNWLYFNVIKGVRIVSNRKLPYEQYIEIIDSSNAILDFHHPDQDGLTIRTIEALGANRKIITTNIDIKNYDFYNKNNCFILSEETEPDELALFLALPYENVDPDIYNSYNFEQWLANIFLPCKY